MNPNKSVYAFGLNRKKPGHFNLAFLANRTSPIQTWVSDEGVYCYWFNLTYFIYQQPVRVSNESYYLFDTQVPTVPSLCDAFKYRSASVQCLLLYLADSRPRHMHESQNPGGGGGKTPYGGRTPARTPAAGRTPGHNTPGHHSVRVPPPSTYSQPPAQSYPYSQPPYGGYPPSAPGGLPPPNGVMIHKTSGWGQSGNW